MAAKPKTGILALTLELYETLAPGLRENRQRWLAAEILPALHEIMDVCFDEAVFTREAIERAITSYEQQGVDGVIVICLTYSPSELALPALAATSLPILVWNTQELSAVDENFTDEDMTANHGVHGTQDLCSVLCRHGVKFSYSTCHPADREAFKAVEDFAIAARAVGRLRKAKVGQLGGAFPHMGDFAVDSKFLARSLGPQVVKLSLGEFLQSWQAAPAEAVADIVTDYRTSYVIAPDISQDELEQTARVEISLRNMTAERNLAAITYLFSAFGEDDSSPTLPFVAACRLMAEGVGFGGEGDIVGALGNLLLNDLEGPASFSEIFTTDFRGNSLFMSHMGEANVAMANQPVEMVARPTPITRTIYRQLALRFSLVAGEATLFALVQTSGGRWRLIVSAMDIVDWTIAQSIPCPQFKLAPRGDVRGWLTAYAKAGGPHHNAVCRGDARAKLKIAAEMLDADYVEV